MGACRHLDARQRHVTTTPTVVRLDRSAVAEYRRVGRSTARLYAELAEIPGSLDYRRSSCWHPDRACPRGVECGRRPDRASAVASRERMSVDEQEALPHRPSDDWPSTPGSILPSRAYLQSWRDQTCVAREFALRDAVEYFDDVPGGASRAISLCSGIGEAMQILEDIACLGTGTSTTRSMDCRTTSGRSRSTSTRRPISGRSRRNGMTRGSRCSPESPVRTGGQAGYAWTLGRRAVPHLFGRG